MQDLKKLLAQAESDSDYREILWRLRWSSGFHCPRCDHDRAYHLPRRELYECKLCGLQSSATSGTFLHGVRNLRGWVEAILSLFEIDGRTAVSMAIRLDRGYATAWFMMHKIRLVLYEALVRGEGDLEISCDLLKTALFKASSETMYVSPEETPSDLRSHEVAQLVPELVAFLVGIYKGVSRKYAQLYITEFSFRRQTCRFDPLNLLSCFVRGRVLSRAKLRAYSAPYIMRLSGST